MRTGYKAGTVPVNNGVWLLTVHHVREGDADKIGEHVEVLVALSMPGAGTAYELSMTPAQARALAALLTAPVVPVC